MLASDALRVTVNPRVGGTITRSSTTALAYRSWATSVGSGRCAD